MHRSALIAVSLHQPVLQLRLTHFDLCDSGTAACKLCEAICE